MDGYAVTNLIDQEPAFVWWIPYVLKKRKAMLQKIKYKYLKRTHKYRIYIPKTVQEALDKDMKNGDTLWGDSIKK